MRGPDETSIEPGGPRSGEIQNRNELLRELERNGGDEIDATSPEPLSRVDLRYRFG